MSSRRYEHMMKIWKGKSKEEGTKMSKPRKDDRGHGTKDKPSHLYLVLDDWSWGYIIRKIDLSLGDPIDSSAGGPGQQPSIVRHGLPRQLPSTSFEFEAPRGYPQYIVGAFDSQILAMHPMQLDPKFKKNNMAGILVYDVRTPSFVVGPPQAGDPDPYPVDPIYIPVGGRIFALAAGSFLLLYPPPYYESDWQEFVWAWQTLPEPPFSHHLVACYAVHSDRRTIFVSVGGEAPATYNFDTAEALMDDSDCRWKHHGDWTMPFDGRAHFVPELSVWVGLSGCRSESDHALQIAAIDEVSEIFEGGQQGMGLKLCKEELSVVHAGEELIGFTLVAMGGGSKFCLVEYIYYESDGEPTASSTGKENEEQQDRRCLMRLTTFSLKYDKNGGLAIGKGREVLQYSVPPEVSFSMLKTPVAFWM